MEKKRSRKIGRYPIIALIMLGTLAYFFVSPVNATTNNILKMFMSRSFTVIRQFVESYGTYAALVSFLLMILRLIAALLPTFLLTSTNANLFGWWKGAILSQPNTITGAAACFYIVRLLGRDVAEELTSRTSLKQINEFFEKRGHLGILIVELLSFTSFNIVSYAAGLTSASFSSFFIATGIGQLPAIIIYSYAGGILTGGARMFVTASLLLFTLSALAVLFRQLHVEKQKQKNSDESMDITDNI